MAKQKKVGKKYNLVSVLGVPHIPATAVKYFESQMLTTKSRLREQENINSTLKETNKAQRSQHNQDVQTIKDLNIKIEKMNHGNKWKKNK